MSNVKMPKLSTVRKMADELSKPVSYTVEDDKTGLPVTFSGKLAGCCNDTAEEIAELAGAQEKAKINFSRKKTTLANGLLSAGEVHGRSPAKLRDVFLLYKATATVEITIDEATKIGAEALAEIKEEMAAEVKEKALPGETPQETGNRIFPLPADGAKGKPATVNKPATANNGEKK